MTYQYSDSLIFEGKKIYLNDELLEDYFEEFPEKKPEVTVCSTALWRGFIASFEIANDELMLADVEALSDSDELFKSVLNDVFPESKKFDWYSGLIRIDDFRGRFDGEPQDGIFEFLEIRNGNLIQKRTMNYEELQVFKEEQFQYFMMTDEVDRVYEFYKKNNEGISEEALNELIRERILYLTKEVYAD